MPGTKRQPIPAVFVVIGAAWLAAAACVILALALTRAAPREIETRSVALANIPPQAYTAIGDGRPTGVAYAPNGDGLVVGTSLGLRRYNAITRELEWTQPLEGWPDQLVWSPDGTLIAVQVSYDLEVRDAATGAQVWVPAEKGTLAGDQMGWSPDGQFLAAVVDEEVWVWEVATGRLAHKLAKNDHWLQEAAGLAWAPLGHTLAVAFRDTRLAVDEHDDALIIWDLSDGEVEWARFKITYELAGHLAWTPDGFYLVMSNSQGAVTLSAETGEILGWARSQAGLGNAALSPDGTRLAMPYADDTVRLLVVPTLNRAATLHTGYTPQRLSWSADGNRLVTSSDFEPDVTVWSVADGTPQQVYALNSYWYEDLAWSPDSQMLAAGSRQNQVHLYTVTGEPVRVLGDAYAHNRTRLDWSSDGQLLAWSGQHSATERGIAQIWTPAGEQMEGVKGSNSDAPLAWSPTAPVLALLSGRQLILWQAETPVRQVELVDNAGQTAAIDWSPDGKQIAVAAYDYGDAEWVNARVELRRAFDLTQMRVLTAPDIESIRSVAWSPDGQRLAATVWMTKCIDYACGRIVVWSVATGAVERWFGSFDRDAWEVEWTRDSQWVLSTEGPNYAGLTLFPIVEGEEARVVNAHQGAVESVAASPDGRWIASAGYDGVVFIWDAAVLTGPQWPPAQP